MRKLYVFALLVVFLAALFFNVQCSRALSIDIVISQIQLGNAGSASNDFIEIYNNSATDVDITNWCLYYASATSVQNGSKLACFLSDSDNVHIYLPSHSFAFLISNQLATANPSLDSDLKFSATLSGTAGHVRLIDSRGVEIDKVGWGVTAVSAEGASPAVTPIVGKVLRRKTIGIDILQDTNVNSEDFEIVSPRATYNYGSIYEKQDLCLNIADIQAVLPDGYSVDIFWSGDPNLIKKATDRFNLDLSKLNIVDDIFNVESVKRSLKIKLGLGYIVRSWISRKKGLNSNPISR